MTEVNVARNGASLLVEGQANAAKGATAGVGEILSAQCLASLTRLPGVVVYQRVVTPDERIFYTYISEGCWDLFGVSPQQILSDPEALFGRHSDEYRAKFRERLLTASKALSTWDVEASIDTVDGRRKYTHAIARPERQADGSVLWTGVYLGRNPHSGSGLRRSIPELIVVRCRRSTGPAKQSFLGDLSGAQKHCGPWRKV